MKLTDLSPAERLKILRSEGGYVAWMKARSQAPAASAAGPGDGKQMVTQEVSVPASAVGLLTQIASALRSGDPARLNRAALALRAWRPDAS